MIEAITLRIVWAPDALLRNTLEALPVLRKRGSISGRCFEPPKDDIAIGGVIFDQTGSASGLLCSNQCSAGATKRIEHDIAPAGRDMLDWKSEHGQIEAQANTFASFLLMPLDDFREQIRSQAITMALMRHLSDCYEVSITAAILKWLGITDKRAMIVVSKDGFIDWSWGSKRLFKSGIYYRARQETVPLPELSLAARRDPSIDAEIGFVDPKGVWVGNEEVNEMRLMPDCDEEDTLDRHDQFQRHA